MATTKQQPTHIDSAGVEVCLIQDPYSEGQIIMSDSNAYAGCEETIAQKHGYKHGWWCSGESAIQYHKLKPITQKQETIKTPKEIYQEMFKAWVKLVDLKVGDTVKVTNNNVADCDLCSSSWSASMNNTWIGKTAKVTKIDTDFYRLWLGLSGGSVVSYSCVEKVFEEPKPEFSSLADLMCKNMYVGFADGRDRYLMIDCNHGTDYVASKIRSRWTSPEDQSKCFETEYGQGKYHIFKSQKELLDWYQS